MLGSVSRVASTVLALITTLSAHVSTPLGDMAPPLGSLSFSTAGVVSDAPHNLTVAGLRAAASAIFW